MFRIDYDQLDWGSTRVYADGDLSGLYEPAYLLIHWGGNTSQVNDAGATLRSWQNYHINSKGMRDIAYNYAVDDFGSIYRLRGMNPNGSNKQVLLDPLTGRPYNNVTVAVVWVGGANDPDGPSDLAKAAMKEIADDLRLYPIYPHSFMKATACPGDDWRDWINTYTAPTVYRGVKNTPNRVWARAAIDYHIDVSKQIIESNDNDWNRIMIDGRYWTMQWRDAGSPGV